MATTAFVLLVLATLVQLGRPARGADALVRGAVVLSRLSDQRREGSGRVGCQA
jgi:hypothetical protein